MRAFPGQFRPIPVLAPAEDGSGDLFVLLRPAHEAGPGAASIVTRFDASGARAWERAQAGGVLSSYGPGHLTGDRDGSVVVSTVVVDGLVPTVVRIAADGASEREVRRSSLPPYEGSSPPLVFERIAVDGDTLAMEVWAPTHWRSLLFSPGGGAPETSIFAGTTHPHLSVRDWVVTRAGSMIVYGAVQSSASVNGVELPSEGAIVFEVEPSGAVAWVSSLPEGVVGQRLRVLEDGTVAFLGWRGTFDAGSQTLVVGTIGPRGETAVTRTVPAGDAPTPRHVALGSRGDVAFVRTDGDCHAHATVAPASGAPPVTRDLGRGFCLRDLALTSEGAFVFSGTFGTFGARIRYGDAPGEVAEQAETFVAVLEPVR